MGSPTFIQANPRGTGLEWFAVVDDRSRAAITGYAIGNDNLTFRSTPTDINTLVPFNNIVTTLMTDMSTLFFNASTFNAPIGSWDTSRVTNMMGMFSQATAFNQPIGAWDTSRVTNMQSMFQHTGNFNQPIGNWNTSNVTNMTAVFQYAHAFNQPIGSWDTSQVTRMGGMFQYAIRFDQPIGGWNTSRVTNMGAMFSGARAFNRPLNTWDIRNVIVTPPNDFSTLSPLTTANQPSWFITILPGRVTIRYNGNATDVPNGSPRFIQANPRGSGMEWFAVVNDSMFTPIRNYARGTPGPFAHQGQNIPFNNIVTTLMTNMFRMFENDQHFNDPIVSWDTSNVTNMDRMFFEARRFNRPLWQWDVRNVITRPPTDFMTGGVNATPLFWSPENQPSWFLNLAPNNITIQYTGSIEYANFLITRRREIDANPRGTGMESFAIVDQSMLVEIRTDANIRIAGRGFNYFRFNTDPRRHIPFNNIVTTLMTDMTSILGQTTAGDHIFNEPIGSWDTSRVTNMTSLLANAQRFNQPIVAWDTSRVTDMGNMLANASSFNQPIGNWNTSQVTNMIAMFLNNIAFNHNTL